MKELPLKIREVLPKYGLEEIRIRANKPLSLKICGEIKNISNILCTKGDIDAIIGAVTNYSVHTYLENIKQGFLTIKGGHRIGISGEVLHENDEILHFKNINSLNIRCANKNIAIRENILKTTKNRSTLVISPPNIGKTTLIRNIIRYLSKENSNISVIDERYEISMDDFDLGVNVDVISGLSKKKSVTMMLKTMSPDYIVLDEITGDMNILSEISNCGVKIIASIHSDSLESIKDKGIIEFFDNFIEISLENGERKYKKGVIE